MGDGVTYETAAIQAAIDECAQHPEGGVVTFEENSRYLSAQIKVKNGVRLRIPKTATLLAGLKVLLREILCQSKLFSLATSTLSAV